MTAEHEFTLGDAFDLQMGKTPSRSNPLYWGGENEWISIADIKDKFVSKTKECISDLAVEETGIKVVPKGTLIMSFKLSVGKVAFAAEDMYTNEAIMAFIDKGKYPIDMEYLYHYLSNQDWRKGTNKAVKGLTLNKKTLSARVIHLPSLDEQREVAYTLNLLDQAIRLCHQLLETADELVKARFVEMFGDPDTNPFKWNEALLSEHLEIIGGYAFKSNGFTDEGIPVLRIGNINSGHFLPVNMVFWPEDPSLKRYKMYPGDLVMSLTGTVGKEDYGNVCILGCEYAEYYLNQRNAKLSLRHTLDKYYLAELLKFPQIKKRLTGISRGVRQANISNKDIMNLRVPIPPIELQNQFAVFAAQTDKSKLSVTDCFKKAEYLKSALVQQYFG